MGLLSSETVELEGEGLPPLELKLPSSDQIEAKRQDVPEEAEDVLAAFEFVTEDGILAESLVLTTARIQEGDRETRHFTMANLLVLRSFSALAGNFPDARILGFGPIQHSDEILAVQMVGTFTSSDGVPIYFRHVGLMPSGTDAAIVAISNLNSSLFEVRTEGDLANSFAGFAVDSLSVTGDSP